MKKLLLVLICGLFATLFSQVKTIDIFDDVKTIDFTDVKTQKGVVIRPTNEYKEKITGHFIDSGTVVWAWVFAIHKKGDTATILKRCLYKKIERSDTGYTTALRNTYFTFGEIFDTINEHR